eukprot:scaffold5020_cov27-Tisochrysis_lutea.AAC.1
MFPQDAYPGRVIDPIPRRRGGCGEGRSGQMAARRTCSSFATAMWHVAQSARASHRHWLSRNADPTTEEDVLLARL